MQIALVFEDWQRLGKSVYNTEEGLELSMGMFHSGTIFEGTIELSPDDQAEVEQAIAAGAHPVFWVSTKQVG